MRRRRSTTGLRSVRSVCSPGIRRHRTHTGAHAGVSIRTGCCRVDPRIQRSRWQRHDPTCTAELVASCASGRPGQPGRLVQAQGGRCVRPWCQRGARHPARRGPTGRSASAVLVARCRPQRRRPPEQDVQRSLSSASGPWPIVVVGARATRRGAPPAGGVMRRGAMIAPEIEPIPPLQRRVAGTSGLGGNRLVRRANRPASRRLASLDRLGMEGSP